MRKSTNGILTSTLLMLTAFCGAVLFSTTLMPIRQATAHPILPQEATVQDDDATPKPKAKPKRDPIYDEKADAEAMIQAALKKAEKENQRVIIQWGANWCGWCYLLHDKMKDSPALARKIRYEYQVITVDVGQFDRNMELAEKYKADLKGNGIPFLTVLNSDGTVVVNQETEALESKEEGKHEHDEKAVMAFLEEHQPKPLVAEDVLASAMKKAEEQNQLVFLHFGAPWCGWCHYLEDWMAEESQSILHQKFVDVKIDTNRMTGGSELLAKYREGDGGIPWFVFLDPKTGKEVANSTSPDGNVGFPSTDQEIEWFGKMLESCGDRFSEKQIQQLKDSLVANRQKREAARTKRVSNP